MSSRSGFRAIPRYRPWSRARSILLYCIPHNVIGAMASGADLQFIASIYNRMQYRIVAAPGIDRVDQLKGKVVGIARIHDVSHFYMRLALKKLGMNPDQDVRVVSTGGQADRTLALKNGRVAATILNPAFAMTLEKDGFKTILDIETLNFPVVGNMSCGAPGVFERSPIRWRCASCALWWRA